MNEPQQWRKSPRPDPSVLELLEALQLAARKGQIRAIAVVTVNPLLEVEPATAGGSDNVKKHLLIGGLHAAIQKVVAE